MRNNSSVLLESLKEDYSLEPVLEVMKRGGTAIMGTEDAVDAVNRFAFLCARQRVLAEYGQIDKTEDFDPDGIEPYATKRRAYGHPAETGFTREELEAARKKLTVFGNNLIKKMREGKGEPAVDRLLSEAFTGLESEGFVLRALCACATSFQATGKIPESKNLSAKASLSVEATTLPEQGEETAFSTVCRFVAENGVFASVETKTPSYHTLLIMPGEKILVATGTRQKTTVLSACLAIGKGIIPSFWQYSDGQIKEVCRAADAVERDLFQQVRKDATIREALCVAGKEGNLVYFPDSDVIVGRTEMLSRAVLSAYFEASSIPEPWTYGTFKMMDGAPDDEVRLLRPGRTYIKE